MAERRGLAGSVHKQKLPSSPSKKKSIRCLWNTDCKGKIFAELDKDNDNKQTTHLDFTNHIPVVHTNTNMLDSIKAEAGSHMLQGYSKTLDPGEIKQYQ